MRKFILGLGAALLIVPTVASAQTAAENFSYKAPSGMFGEGTAKWQMYRYLHEDRERTEALNAGRDIPTGSVQGTAIGNEQYARPGETGSRRTNRR